MLGAVVSEFVKPNFMSRRAIAGKFFLMSRFPSRRAFVVKLGADADCAHLVGRIEHVESGQTVRFETLEGLGDFLAQVIDLERNEAARHEETI
jgi:hypothetical protein